MSKNKKALVVDDVVVIEDDQPAKVEVATTKPKTALTVCAELYAKVKAAAEVNLEFSDPRTISGRQAAKRDASEKLPKIKDDFEKLLKRGQFGVYVNGPSHLESQFRDAVEENEIEAVYLDVRALYKRLASAIEPLMRADRSIEPTQHAALVQAYAKVGEELGLPDLPALKFTGGRAPKTFEGLIDEVRKIIRESGGDRLNILFLQSKISETALKIRYHQDILPVVLMGATPAEVEGLRPLFSHRFATRFNTEAGVNKELVRDFFLKLRSKLMN